MAGRVVLLSSGVGESWDSAAFSVVNALQPEVCMLGFACELKWGMSESQGFQHCHLASEMSDSDFSGSSAVWPWARITAQCHWSLFTKVTATPWKVRFGKHSNRKLRRQKACQTCFYLLPIAGCFARDIDNPLSSEILGTVLIFTPVLWLTSGDRCDPMWHMQL